MQSWFVLVSLVLALAGESQAYRTSGLSISRSGRCGSSFQLTCKGSTFGNCCSKHGYCGSTKDYCGSGCQSNFGTCSKAPAKVAASSPSTAAVAKKPSSDGTCGGSKGRTCSGSTFGNCCRLVLHITSRSFYLLMLESSRYGYCGSSSAYCGSGCQSQFGKCTHSTPSTTTKCKSSTSSRSIAKSTRRPTYSFRPTSSARPSSSAPVASPSTVVKVSTNGRCGAASGFTCMGSRWGNCCSQHSYW